MSTTPTPSASSSDRTTAIGISLIGLLGLSLFLGSLPLLGSVPTSPPSLPRGIPGTASDPADTWVKKPYVSTGQAPIPLKNEYGLEINSRDPATHAINQMMTECARAAGITDKIDKQHMLILTTCIDSKTGAYKR